MGGASLLWRAVRRSKRLVSPAAATGPPFLPPLCETEGHAALKDVIVHPLRVDKTAEGRPIFRTGLQGRDGRFHPEGAFLRCGVRHPIFPNAHPPPVVAGAGHVEQAIFCGPLFHHFGHFLLESLSRLSNRPPDATGCLPWTEETGRERPGFRSWQRDILDLLGLPGQRMATTVPIEVRHLTVPAPGLIVRHAFTEAHDAFLSVVRWRPEAGRRVWLSRRNVPGAARPAFHALEPILAAAGWRVIVPEDLPVRIQLAELAKAEQVAGEEGSALHALLLLDRAAGLRVDIFPRPAGPDMPELNDNYHTIAERKGFDQRVHARHGSNDAGPESLRAWCLERLA